MSTRITALVVLALGLVACAVPEDQFPEEYASTYCKRASRCEPDFDDWYDNKAECRDDVAASMEQVMEVADFFGEYDPAAAGECLRAMRSGNCGDFVDGDFDGACDHIFGG